MECTEVRQQIIDGEINPEIQRHIAKCMNCAEFFSAVNRIRDALANQLPPEPDEKLVAATQRACQAELKKIESHWWKKYLSLLPAGIWFVTFAITILTIIWILLVFHYPQTPVAPNWQVWVGIVIILQNIISLILSPVLFKGPFETFRIENS